MSLGCLVGRELETSTDLTEEAGLDVLAKESVAVAWNACPMLTVRSSSLLRGQVSN